MYYNYSIQSTLLGLWKMWFWIKIRTVIWLLIVKELLSLAGEWRIKCWRLRFCDPGTSCKCHTNHVVILCVISRSHVYNLTDIMSRRAAWPVTTVQNHVLTLLTRDHDISKLARVDPLYTFQLWLWWQKNWYFRQDIRTFLVGEGDTTKFGLIRCQVIKGQYCRYRHKYILFWKQGSF